MLRIGVEPQIRYPRIGPQQIAGPDHFGSLEHALCTSTLDRHGWVKPWIKAKLQQPIAIPLLHLLGSRYIRCDDRARKSLADQGVGGAYNRRVAVSIFAGEPGYRADMDRDSDDIVCEP